MHHYFQEKEKVFTDKWRKTLDRHDQSCFPVSIIGLFLLVCALETFFFYFNEILMEKKALFEPKQINSSANYLDQIISHPFSISLSF